MIGATRAADTPFPSRFFRDRTELFAFVGLLDAFNGFSDRLADMARKQDLFGALMGAGGISIVGWFAFYAIATIALEARRDDRPDRFDLALAAIMLVAAFLPMAAAGGCGLLAGGLWLALRSNGGSGGRRVAALLLALTGPTLIGQLLLNIFAPPLLGLDAVFAARIAGAEVVGNYMGFVGRAAGDGVYVAPGCSSLHNISLAVLLWTTIVQLLRLRVTLRLVGACLLAAVAMAVINIFRLAAIARFPDQFTILHDGYGADLIGLFSLFVSGAIIAMGVVSAARREA